MAGLKSLLSLSIFSSVLLHASYSHAEGLIGGQEGKAPQSTATSVSEAASSAGKTLSDAASSAASGVKDFFSSAFGGSDPVKDAAETKAKGLDAEFQQIKSSAEDLFMFLDPSQKQALSKGFQKYSGSWANCIERQAAAAKLCLANNNDDLKAAIPLISGLLSTTGLTSVYDSCTAMGKAAGIASTALTAYTTYCSVSQSACGWSCLQARNGAQEMLKAVSSPVCLPGTEAHCMTEVANIRAAINNELKEKSDLSVASKVDKCSKQYVQLLASAGVGLANVKKVISSAQNCGDNTNGNSVATSLAEKCAVASNQTLPDCICYLNPRTNGCANSYSKLDSSEATTLSVGSTSESKQVGTTSSDGVQLTDDLLSGSRQPTSDSGGGIAGAPVKGGNAGGQSLGGSGGGSGGKGGGADGVAAKTPNVSTGIEGGGGGGGRGFSLSSSPEAAKYRAYLPGGTQDPAKAMLGQEAWKKEVTGEAGKSNWEKVRDRYRDNNATLLNK